MTEAALFAMAAIWGVNFPVVKWATRYFAPLAFNGLRVLLATVVVLVIVGTFLRSELPTRRDIRRLAALGVIGHGAYQTCFILGIARTTVGTAALVLAASPAMIALVGRALGVERPARRAWAGIALQLAGVGAVVVGTSLGVPAGAAAPSAVGPLLMLGAAVSWAFYAVLLKPYAERVHPMHLSAWTMLGGVLLLCAAAVVPALSTDWAAVPPAGWGAVAYSGVGALVLAYLCYYRGVRVLGPTRTAMFTNLQPIIAIVVAYATLGETPTAWQLVGAVSIMTGLVIARS
jgi:drug/metabolite transporter (DMT)-like permease